jgi:hypothetical protein
MWEEYVTSKASKSAYLFKFLSKNDYQRFVKSGNIWFSRSDVFGDKMECVMIRDLEKTRPNFKAIEERKQKNLISCWHMSNTETLAFWDTYSEKEEKRRIIAIRFKKNCLIEYLLHSFDENKMPKSYNKLLHGDVRYRSLLSGNYDILQKKKLKYPAFRKEFTFRYERE